MMPVELDKKRGLGKGVGRWQDADEVTWVKDLLLGSKWLGMSLRLSLKPFMVFFLSVKESNQRVLLLESVSQLM